MITLCWKSAYRVETITEGAKSKAPGSQKYHIFSGQYLLSQVKYKGLFYFIMAASVGTLKDISKAVTKFTHHVINFFPKK